MKTFCRLVKLMGLSIIGSSIIVAQGLSIPQSNDGVADVISTDLPAPLTPTEQAIPPSGEIQRLYLRDITTAHSDLSTTLANVPVGSEGQGSIWFGKLDDIKTALLALKASALQSDCFSIITPMKELLDAQINGVLPEFAVQALEILDGVSVAIIHAISRHIEDQSGVVTQANLELFIKVFSTIGFVVPSDWEDEPIWVDAAGIVVLDAAAVVLYLQSLPWKQAEQFLKGKTAGEAFTRYAPSGNGLSSLKAKFTLEGVTIVSKWSELESWVVVQSSP